MMLLSQEINIKLYQNYTKTYICKISYEIRSIRQIIFNKYATNLKKNDIPEEPEKLKFAAYLNLIIFHFNRWN